MKLANPLHYPLAVLAGGLVLVAGVRLGRLPNWVAVPGAVAIATLSAVYLQSREPQVIELANPALTRELQAVQQQARDLVVKADALKAEATTLLIEVHQLELLGTVQYGCDRTQELPQKINQLAQRLQGKDALLSVNDLEKQLQGVRTKIKTSAGIAQDQWSKLADSLERNIALAKQGEDARQAQVANLSTLIAEAGGVLQQLQNKLRTADLNNAAVTMELRDLSDEFKGFQETVDLLIA
jgi:chromosome segregation ATPase